MWVCQGHSLSFCVCSVIATCVTAHTCGIKILLQKNTLCLKFNWRGVTIESLTSEKNAKNANLKYAAVKNGIGPLRRVLRTWEYYITDREIQKLLWKPYITTLYPIGWFLYRSASYAVMYVLYVRRKVIYTILFLSLPCIVFTSVCKVFWIKLFLVWMSYENHFFSRKSAFQELN